MQSNLAIATPEAFAAAIAAHEHYVFGRPGGKRANLKFLRAPGINLSYRRLEDIELSGAELERANLAGANLTRASLSCANITGADLTGTILRRADLRGARVEGANFEFADMDGADFRQSTIAMTDRDGRWTLPANARSPSVSFANCSLKRAKLNNANLKNAKFDGAILNQASFVGATLDNATFDGAVLIGVNVKELRVPADRLKNCITDPSPELIAKLPRFLTMLDQTEAFVRSGGRDGTPASFEGEDIRLLAQHMKKRLLTGINLKNTVAVNTDFTGCELQAAKFDGADLRGAIFVGADLRGASFTNANLAHAEFVQADLLALELTSGTKMPTLFEGAVLHHANFDRAKR
jgi:uncharacterized protein YjbI with pentapeptide repeats